MTILKLTPNFTYTCSEREWVLLWVGEDILPFYIHRRRICYNVVTGEFLEEERGQMGYGVKEPILVLTQVISTIEVITNEGYWKYYLNWR